VLGSNRNWIDFENHNLELTQLSIRTKSILKKIPKITSRLDDYGNTLSKENENQEKKDLVEKVQNRIFFFESFLTQSKKHLTHSMDHAEKTALHVSQTKEKINWLKDEFNR
jgi:hypothetical protein